jgi:hypothetical protein
VHPDTQTLFHADLITEAISQASGLLKALQTSVSFEEFVVEVLVRCAGHRALASEVLTPAQMVKLQLQFMQHVTGYVHVQTNPKLSYSTSATVGNARRKRSKSLPVSIATNKRRHCRHIQSPGTTRRREESMYQNPSNMGGPPGMPHT